MSMCKVSNTQALKIVSRQKGLTGFIRKVIVSINISN